VQEADSNLQINGFTPAKGSTNTAIVTISSGSIAKNIGNHIVWSSSATLGDTFTATKSGVYSFSFSSDLGSASDRIGFSKNSSQLTTAVTAINSFDRLLTGIDVGSTGTINCAWTGLLVIGDIVRLHSSTTAFTAASVSDSTFSCSYQGSLKQVTVNTNSKITIPTSELRFEGASSRGSTATAIVRFDTMAKIRGDAFSIVSDAVNGTAITMLKAGKLDVSASLLAGDITYYLSRNQASLTVTAPTASETLSVSSNAAARVKALAWSGFVNLGDVVRISGSTVVSATADAGNSLNLSFQEQEIQVSVSNTLPQFSESDSSVRVDTANGYGSTGTRVIRFSNVRDNIGTDVEYVDSATNGASFTAKTSGMYDISAQAIFTAQIYFAITKNASSLSTDASSLATTEQLRGTLTPGANQTGALSCEVYLVAGDVIRLMSNAATLGTASFVGFTMSKVGKPNVTGVNVTPFVNVPQPVKESVRLSGHTGYGSTSTGILRFTSVANNTNNRVLSYVSDSVNGDYFIANKSCTFSGEVTANIPTASPYIYIGVYSSLATQLTGQVVASAGIYTVSSQQLTTASGTQAYATSFTGKLEAGQYLRIGSSVNTVTAVSLNINAEALSDQILTAPETFSTDTAALQYAGSGVYTLATLANAPVGTYITFTYAASTNTRTQTTTRPTQTDADMNANGMLIYTRVFTAASTAAQPSTIALQIGKGLKGISRGTYKSAGKVTSGNLDFFLDGSTQQRGALVNSYNEVTGILIVDLGAVSNGTISNSQLYFDDVSSTTNGYLVVNASKNPALTGMNLNRVAAQVVQTSGQSFTNATTTKVVWDANPVFADGVTFSSSNNRFTINESGNYTIGALLFTVSLTWSQAQQMQLLLYKNGVLFRYLDQKADPSTITKNMTVGGSTLVKASKDDYFEIFCYYDQGAGALSTGAGANYFSIAKVSI
jgi:hypothetical protein